MSKAKTTKKSTTTKTKSANASKPPASAGFYAGIDLGRTSAMLCVLDSQGVSRLGPKEFPLSAKGLKNLRKVLARFDNLAIAFEPTGNPSLTLLKELDGCKARLYQINGRVILRRATSMTQTKTDQADALAIAQTLRDIAITRPEQLANFSIAWDEERANLALFATEYAERAEDLRRLKVRADHLKHHSAPAVTELRKRAAADLDAARKAKEQAKQEMIAAARLCNADMLELLLSIPGIGEVLAPNLIHEIGDIDRFKTAGNLKGFMGAYPARRQSGGTERPAHLARHGSASMKTLLFMAAQVAARFNPPCKRLYDRLIAGGKKPIVAIGAVMRKLVQIIYGVLKNKEVFRPDFA